MNEQDYAQELFNLSRANGRKVCVIEKAWASDVASYIVELENLVKIQNERLAEALIDNVLSTTNEEILKEVAEEYGDSNTEADIMKRIIECTKQEKE